jgi:hypothetical protein
MAERSVSVNHKLNEKKWDDSACRQHFSPSTSVYVEEVSFGAPAHYAKGSLQSYM